MGHSARVREVRRHHTDWLETVRLMGNTSLALLLFDVGANNGAWTAEMLKQVNELAPGSAIEPHIFEPQPTFAPALQALAESTPTGVFLPAAAHTRGGSLTFHFGNTGDTTSASLVTSFKAGAAGNTTVATMDFARHLCLRARGCPVDSGCIGFLKIDVEGAEYVLISHVVRHAASALCRLFTHILVEWHLDKTEPEMRRKAFALQMHLNETLQWGCRGQRLPYLAHDPIPVNNRFAADPSEVSRALRGTALTGQYATWSDRLKTLVGGCPAPPMRRVHSGDLLSEWRQSLPKGRGDETQGVFRTRTRAHRRQSAHE